MIHRQHERFASPGTALAATLASSALASSPDTVRPQLFGQLGLGISMVFSGGDRVLYERSILAVYDDLYRSDLLFPSQAEVVGMIYDCLRQEPGLWTDGGQKPWLNGRVGCLQHEVRT